MIWYKNRTFNVINASNDLKNYHDENIMTAGEFSATLSMENKLYPLPHREILLDNNGSFDIKPLVFKVNK